MNLKHPKKVKKTFNSPTLFIRQNTTTIISFIIAVASLICGLISIDKDYSIWILQALTVIFVLALLFVLRKPIMSFLNRESIQRMANSLDELATYVRENTSLPLVSRIFHLNHAQQLYIIHSHRPNLLIHRGYDEYAHAELCIDEAEFLLMSWHWAVNILGRDNVFFKCSCPQALTDLEKNHNDCLFGHLILIGSTKANEVVRRFQEKLKDSLTYTYETINNNVILRSEKDEKFRPGPHKEREVEDLDIPNGLELYIDYGMITNVWNPFDYKKGHIVIVGGCHRQAQLGLTRYLADVHNLMDIHTHYGARYFQQIIKQYYWIFGRDPDKWKLLDESEEKDLKLSKIVARTEIYCKD